MSSETQILPPPSERSSGPWQAAAGKTIEREVAQEGEGALKDMTPTVRAIPVGK